MSGKTAVASRITNIAAKGLLPAAVDFGVLDPLAATVVENYGDVGPGRGGPIQRCPVELLSTIFLHCLPDARLPKPSASEPPLVLGRICKKWRTVALATPQLWAGLALSYRKPERVQERDAVAVKEWIARSGSCPLSFDFSFNHVGAEFMAGQPDDIRHVVDMIIPHSHRWRVLRASLPLTSFLRILQALHGIVPRLEFLDLATVPGHNMLSSLAVDISSAHRLKLLHIKGACCKVYFGDAVLNNLKTVSLPRPSLSGSPLSITDCLRYLSQCPNVETFTIDLGYDQMYPVPELRMLEMAHLTSFRLSTSSPFDPAPLLDRIRLPALELLSVDIGRPTPAQLTPWPHLASLLDRSGSRLEFLALNSTPMTEDDLLQLLQLTPQLSHLRLNFTVFTDTTLRALTMKEESDTPNLCPHLESLSLYMGDNRYRDTRALRECLLSRRKQLRSVGLTAYHDFETLSREPEIMTLVRGGLTLIGEQLPDDEPLTHSA